MLQDDFLFIGFLLNKLKEDLFNFQNSIRGVDSLQSTESIERLLKQSLFILNENAQLLETLSKNQVDVKLKKEILNVSYNILQTIFHFYKRVESSYPLFLDNITVFFEPVSSKIEQILKVLNSPDIDSLDTEELSYVLNEIIETLETVFYMLRKMDENFYN